MFVLGFRQFLFKINQGLVHGNTVVSHFAEVDRRCTFCSIKLKIALRQRLNRDPTDAEKRSGKLTARTKIGCTHTHFRIAQ
jgi:hypothetical protein